MSIHSTTLNLSRSKLAAVRQCLPCLCRQAPLFGTTSTSFSASPHFLGAATAQTFRVRLRTSSRTRRLWCISCASPSALHQCLRFPEQDSLYLAISLATLEYCGFDPAQLELPASLLHRSRARRFGHRDNWRLGRTRRLARPRQPPCQHHQDNGCIVCASSSHVHSWCRHSSGLCHTARRAR